jgi:hypothetical protein
VNIISNYNFKKRIQRIQNSEDLIDSILENLKDIKSDIKKEINELTSIVSIPEEAEKN